MSIIELQSLVGRALIDREFCERLLNGGRAGVLDAFELTEHERETLLAISADSVQEFAAGLHERLVLS